MDGNSIDNDTSSAGRISCAARFLNVDESEVKTYSPTLIDLLVKKAADTVKSESHSVISAQLHKLILEKASLLDENSSLSNTIEKNIAFINSSKAELEKYKESNISLNNENITLKNNLESSKLNEFNLNNSNTRLSSELKLLKEKRKENENKILKKTQNMLYSEEENKSKLNNILEQLEHLRNENSLVKANNNTLLEKNIELSTSLQLKLGEVQELSHQLTYEKSEFLREMGVKERINNMLQEQLRELQHGMNIDFETALKGNHESEHNKLIEELSNAKTKLEEAGSENKRLKSLLYGKDDETKNKFFDHKSKARLERLLFREKEQNKTLKEQVQNIVFELEEKIPALKSLENRTKVLENELTNVLSQLDRTFREKENVRKEFSSYKRRMDDLSNVIEVLKTQRTDLARQLQYILAVNSIKQGEHGSLDRKQLEFIQKVVMNENSASENDSQNVITERLVNFGTITELQEKNMQLVQTIRSLSNRLEHVEKGDYIDQEKTETVESAKKAIVVLQEHNDNLQAKLTHMEASRDALKVLCDGLQHADGQQPIHGDNSLNEQISNLLVDITDIKLKAANEKKLLEDQLFEKDSKLKTLQNELNSRIPEVNLLHDKLELLDRKLEESQTMSNRYICKIQELEVNIAKKTESEKSLNSTISEIMAKCESKDSNLLSLKNNIEKLMSEITSLKNELFKTLEERNELRLKVTFATNQVDENERTRRAMEQIAHEKIEQLNKDNLLLKDELAFNTEEYQKLSERQKTQSKWFKEHTDAVESKLMEVQSELKQKDEVITQLKEEVKHAESLTSEVASSSDNTTDPVLEITNLKNNLSESQIEILKYKELSERLQKSLDELSESWSTSKKEYERRLQKIKTGHEESESISNKANDEFKKLPLDYTYQEDNTKQQNSSLQKSIINLDENLESVKHNLEVEIQSLKTELEASNSTNNLLTESLETARAENLHVQEEISRIKQCKLAYEKKLDSIEKSELEVNHIVEEKAALDEQLDYMNERVENLSRQNEILFDQINNKLTAQASESSEQPTTDISELVLSLRQERDSILLKYNVAYRELAVLKQHLATAKYTESLKVSKEEVHTDTSKKYDTLIDDVKELSVLRNDNISLKNKLDELKTEDEIKTKKIEALESEVQPIKTAYSELEHMLSEGKQKISLLEEESNRWKSMIKHLNDKEVSIESEKKQLLENVEHLKVQLSEAAASNTELDDRFNRLKKQAHEKLDSSKSTVATLTSELESANISNVELEKVVEEQKQKINSLDEQLSLSVTEKLEATKVREDLEETIRTSKENECKFIETIEELKKQVEKLRSDLLILQSKKNDPVDEGDELMNKLRNDFEREKADILEKEIGALKEKYESEINKLNAEKETRPISLESSQDIDLLKKSLEEEWEKITLQRIENAKEDLKKHIRLPTEEKINKILEKKRQELENEFNKRVEEKAAMLSSTNGSVDYLEGAKDELRKEIEKELDNDLKAVKKKSFEEGKQQAMMKMTFLEKKISKLEDQLRSAREQTSQRSHDDPASERSNTENNEKANETPDEISKHPTSQPTNEQENELASETAKISDNNQIVNIITNSTDVAQTKKGSDSLVNTDDKSDSHILETKDCEHNHIGVEIIEPENAKSDNAKPEDTEPENTESVNAGHENAEHGHVEPENAESNINQKKSIIPPTRNEFNPFTSPSSSASPVTVPMFGMKPTFSFGNPNLSANLAKGSSFTEKINNSFTTTVKNGSSLNPFSLKSKAHMSESATASNSPPGSSEKSDTKTGKRSMDDDENSDTSQTSNKKTRTESN